MVCSFFMINSFILNLGGWIPEAEATSCINQCISGLFHEGLFIPAPRAEQLARLGLRFLSLYAELAGLCFSKKMNRFPLTPKGHYLHHQLLGLLHQAQKSAWCVNIIAYAVQMQEDYIGKPSRLARRVSCRTTSLRVIQRTFLAMRAAVGAGDTSDEN